MVLPLQKLCLAAIRDSLKDQPNPYLHHIPPPNYRQNFRQYLLDLVLASGGISQKSAYTSLSSLEYLDGLSHFNTQRGITSDREFLDLVADSLSVQRNGNTIGEGITELRLNIYTWCFGGVRVALTLSSAVRVISQCPNLKILHLSLVNDKLGRKRWKDESEKSFVGLPAVSNKSWGGGILNQIPPFAPCLHVLENLEELSFSTEEYSQGPCLAGKRPILNFCCLSSLRLCNVLVDAKLWKEFLMVVQYSLIEFEALNVESGKWIMPFPLPKLCSFKMEDSGQYTRQLITNLMECPKLEKVKMLLYADKEKQDAMQLLSQMNANVSVELGIVLRVAQYRDQYFDRDFNFKWVNLLKEKIKKVKFFIWRWDTEHSTALENSFATCPDLVELSFDGFPQPYPERQDPEREGVFNRLMAAVNSDLVPYLRDQSFVSKLRKLALQGPFDHAVLEAIFENAANLESLKMQHCPQLSDSHLQLWASCGGQPEHLELENCVNITDHGLVPILVSSGERMKYFGMRDSRMDRISNVAWRTLFVHCPLFDFPSYFSKHLTMLLGSECPEYLRR